MADTKPYGGTSVERFVNLLNHDNQSSLQLGIDFTLGNVVVEAGSGARNTKVRLKPIDSAKYREQDIRYRRLSLAVLQYLPEGYITPVQIDSLPFTIHEKLADINAALGLDLTPEEVVNTTYTEPQASYRLTIANPTASMAWLSSFYDFAVEGDFLGVRYTTDGKPRMTTDGQLRRIITE